MSDIVERLYNADSCQWNDVINDCREAAGRIDVWKAEIARMEEVLDDRHDEITELRAENARLRAGYLEMLERNSTRTLTIDRCLSIADAALEY